MDSSYRVSIQSEYLTDEAIMRSAVIGCICYSGESSACKVTWSQGSALAPHARQPRLLLDR